MRHILIIAVLLSGVLTVNAQKVKYKDLFILLRAENFPDADPYLRSYLTDDPEYPNANYYMGKMLEMYMHEQDLLKNSGRAVELADSAKLYFDKAKAFIDEKDVKKHEDDYYADFRRRDLRTGKFEVKLSDVQLDIDTRNDEIASFKKNLMKLMLHFNAAKTAYEQCRLAYQKFTETSETLLLFQFTAGADELQQLRDIASSYDSTLYNLNTYRAIFKALNPQATPQTLVENTIGTYAQDGISDTDFLAQEISLWNYKAWAQSSLDIIGKQIFPMKHRMVLYDQQLAELSDKVYADTLDARSSIFRLATENVGKDLRDYDDASLPAAIFDFRIGEINYRSTINFWYRLDIDTIDIGTKIDALVSLEEQWHGMDKLAQKLSLANTPPEQRVFKDFLDERYNGSDGIDAFIAKELQRVLDDSVQILKWKALIYEQDKISIWHQDTLSLIQGNNYKNDQGPVYSTIRVDRLDSRTRAVYAWSQTADSLFLAFAKSPSSRKFDTLFYAPINNFTKASGILNVDLFTDSLGVEDRVWALNYTGKKDEEHLLQVISTNLTTGPRWNREFKVTAPVTSIKLGEDRQHILFYTSEEQLVLKLSSDGNEEEAPNTSGDGGTPDN